MGLKVFLAFAPGLSDPRTPGQGERVIFVREGFEFWAFVLTLPWLILKRAWFGVLVYVVAFSALQVILALVSTPSVTTILISLTVSLLAGLEASHLVQVSLRYRGYVHVASVVAPNLAEAELKFFRDYQPRNPTPPRQAVDHSVLGLFPERGGRA
jgi:hypothetical protein